MDERNALAAENELPLEIIMSVSETYTRIAEKITGQKIVLSDNPKAEIIEILRNQFGLIG
jgi:phosphoribosylaminoimidazole-succinocarboxamide synthase